MVAFNFMKRFAEDVEEGRKLQTIRKLRKDGRVPCKPGDRLQLYTGMRSPSCRLLHEATCSSILQISIQTDGAIFLSAVEKGVLSSVQRGGWAPLDTDHMNELARADGFEDPAGLIEFFSETHGLPFDGYLIKWRFDV